MAREREPPPTAAGAVGVDFPFRNLVFEGAGVRNCAYAGALLALEEYGVFEQVKRVAGTSSGAIAATLVSAGYSPPEIRQAMLDLDFARIRDGKPLTGPAHGRVRYKRLQSEKRGWC
ncbi:MAG: patatin-like phospholipase family protein [Myxococcaceae bacterium]